MIFGQFKASLIYSTADELERELRRLQREHLDKMYGLQKELDDLRILLMMERSRPPNSQTVVHHPAEPPVSLVILEFLSHGNHGKAK